MTGGGVNYSAANLVRELETQGKKYARNTIIPSTWGPLRKWHELQNELPKV